MGLEVDQTEFKAMCLRTASDMYFGHKVRQSHAICVIYDVIDAISALDRLKKTMFYGKELGPVHIAQDELDFATCQNWPNSIADCSEEEKRAEMLIHGIIGKVTEAGELLEALVEAIQLKRQIDTVNVMEEVGDGMWYDALIAEACSFDLTEAQEKVIAKLQLRFPDKFTQDCAINRDVSAERKVLEK